MVNRNRFFQAVAALFSIFVVFVMVQARIQIAVEEEVRRVITNLIPPGEYEIGSTMQMWHCDAPVFQSAAKSGKYRKTYCWDGKDRQVK